jgi:O-antigen/teichoic acid export membrane protein
MRTNFIMKLLQKLSGLLGSSKGVIYVSIGNFVSISLGTLLWFILATQMTASSFGSLNYYISIATISMSFGIMGFDTTLTTFLAKGVTKMGPQASLLVLITGITISIILLLIFMSAALVLAFLGLLFFTLSVAECLGKHLYKEFMMILTLGRLLSLILVPVLYTQNSFEGALYGYAIAYLALSYRFAISLTKLDFSLSTLKPIKTFFFHSYALTVSKQLLYFSDKLIIMPLFGPILLGYYQFGFQVLITVSVIPLIVTHYFLPEAAANRNSHGKGLQAVAVISSIIMTIILIIFVPSIILNFFSKFQASILPTQIILLAGTPLTISAIYTSTLMAKEKSFHVFLSSAMFLIIEYTLLFILGSLYGLIGLSVSVVVATAIQALYLFIVKNRTIH